MQAQPDLSYVARPKRWSITADAEIIDACERRLLARLWNISLGGFAAECEEKFPLGARIIVDLPGRGPVRAEVRWAVGWRFGAMILGEAEDLFTQNETVTF
jgi:hypothetical protein